MKKSTTRSPDIKIKRERRALTPESREEQLIGLAMDNAEELLLSGNAPAQIITHYLKLGSIKERKEVERLNKEIDLMQAKIDALESSQRMEELYSKAIEAMQIYKGGPNDEIE
jgi:hypothetical protein